MKPKLIVTGATGFLGSRMVAFLKGKGYFVKGIVRPGLKNPYRARWYEKADTIEVLDLRDEKKTAFSFKGFDWVFHFAADMGGVGYFSEQNFYPFMNNMRIDLNVVEACLTNKVKRLFYAASACAYPIDIQKKEGHPPRLREDMLIPANADRMYGWEKLVMVLLSEYAPFDMRVGIFNTVFGEGLEGVGPRAKFPQSIAYKVIEAKKRDIPIEIWGNGKQIRTFLYIEDALEKVYELMASKKYFGPVNIAGDELVTVKQCADWLCEFAGIKPQYTYLPNKPSGVLARGIDNSKFYKHYTYRNTFTTREGFRRLYEFMIKHRK